MSSRTLCHLLYTNAPGQDGTGFRVLAVNLPGSTEEQRTIQDWLTSLKLVEGQQNGWAVRGFSVDRRPTFALALVERLMFAYDDHGREGGHLAHALLVLLEEGKPAGNFGLALFDKAKSFLEIRSVPPSFDAYLEGVKLATTLEVPDLALNNFRGPKQPFQEAFYAAACAGGNGEVFLPGYTSDDELPEHLLTASQVLPPRLRLDLSWRVGLRPGKEGFVVRAAKAELPSPPVGNLGTAYLETVLAQLRTGHDQQVARFASTNWGVRQWSGLQQAFVQPEAEEIQEVVTASTPDPDPFQESEDMEKKRSAAGSAPAAASPKRGKSAAELEAEYQALQEELEEYINQRLGQLGAPPAPGSAPRPPHEPRDRNASGLVMWRPEIYFLILLLLGGLAYRNLRPTAPPDPPDPTDVSPTPAESTPTPEETETPAAAQPSDPLAEWKSFVESPEAANWFQRIANGSGLDKDQVSPKQQNFFKALADLRREGQRLNDTELANSRIGSFEYVHARWAKDKNLPSQAKNQVTLEPSEADLNIKNLVSDLGLTEIPGTKLSATDPKVQAAVTLAWIRRQTRTSP